MAFLLIYQGISGLSSFSASSGPGISGGVEMNTASTLEAFPGWGALNASPRVKKVIKSKPRVLQIHGAAAPEQPIEALRGVVLRLGLKRCTGILHVEI